MNAIKTLIKKRSENQSKKDQELSFEKKLTKMDDKLENILNTLRGGAKQLFDQSDNGSASIFRESLF